MDTTALAQRVWNDVLESNPLLATQVGDGRFDDRLPDVSPTGIADRRNAFARDVEDARRHRVASATVRDRVVCDAVEAIAEPEVSAIDLGMHRFAPVDHLWGPGTLLEQLAAIQRADTPERVSTYLRRLAAFDAHLRASAALLSEDPAGSSAPRLVVERCVRQVERILATDPAESPAVRPIPAADREARSRVESVLRSTVLPAYARYLDALRVYRERARTTTGLCALPGGDEMYAVTIRRWTSLPLSAAEIHAVGVEEEAKIQAERTQVATALGAHDPAAAVAAYAADPRHRFTSRDEIVDTAREQAERAWNAARGAFTTLPPSPCEVRPVDASREDDVLEHYVPAAGDGSRPAVYYVNTAHPEQRPRHSLASTTFHETTPGHHLQTGLEQSVADRPALLRFGGELAGSAFAEGWGLYAERLADELGLYLDEYERLGMLELQAFRAVRLVVDTGLHALGWPRGKAVEALKATGLEPGRAELETDRYIAMPGQALAYKLGQIEIETERRRQESVLGAQFSLPAFHERVLDLGSVPLTSFRRELADGVSAAAAEETR